MTRPLPAVSLPPGAGASPALSAVAPTPSVSGTTVTLKQSITAPLEPEDPLGAKTLGSVKRAQVSESMNSDVGALKVLTRAIDGGGNKKSR